MDLNTKYRQSDGQELTPYQQARRYAAGLPLAMHPRWIVACNFTTFEVHDMEHPNDAPEFIEQNWRMILHDFDRREVEVWLEEKETDESYEQWENAWLEYNHDYAEYMDEEYCAALLELVNRFKDMDSAWLHENRYS